MIILIAGATGFVGRFLVPALLNEGHQIIVLGRSKKAMGKTYPNNVTLLTWDQLDSLSPDEVNCVINLAGRNISMGRWTRKTKQAIKDSRIESTLMLAQWCAKATRKPHLYNASAVGVYGIQTSAAELPPARAESFALEPPSDYLSEVGQAWEQATTAAVQAGVPVTLMRFGVILKRGEGALKKIVPIFYLGMGGPIGFGLQPFSWIHIDDLVRAIQFLLQRPDMVGPVNLTAPECVQQKTFAQTLAKIMRRPAFMGTPAWLAKMMVGRQKGNELLLSGQNVYPERLLQEGFQFTYPSLQAALQHEWKK